MAINNHIPLMERKGIYDLRFVQEVDGNTVFYTADGMLFTGIVEEGKPHEFANTEYEVRDGMKDGVQTEFYSPGIVECISHYSKGMLHGDTTYYYGTGIPKEKSVFEYDICLEEFIWNEDGILTHHQLLELDDYQQVILTHNRNIKI